MSTWKSGEWMPKGQFESRTAKAKHTARHAVLTGINVCDEEKKSSNYSILKRPHFCISRNLKKEEIKTTFVVILLTGSRKALTLWSRVRHNLLLWLADEGCRNTLNGLRKRVLKIDP